MTEALLSVMREGLVMALLLAAPALVGAAVVGIAMGLVRAITQIDDPSVGLLPRVAAVGGAYLAFAPAIAKTITAFAHKLTALIAQVGGVG